MLCRPIPLQRSRPRPNSERPTPGQPLRDLLNQGIFIIIFTLSFFRERSSNEGVRTTCIDVPPAQTHTWGREHVGSTLEFGQTFVGDIGFATV
ncbi:hypothetical protein H1R20_g6665, partial [Candolleomyces eurysporus]